MISLASELASVSSFVKGGVLSLARLTYAGPDGADGCAEGMEDIGGTGDSDMDWIAGDDWPDGSRKVNSSG